MPTDVDASFRRIAAVTAAHDVNANRRLSINSVIDSLGQEYINKRDHSLVVAHFFATMKEELTGDVLEAAQRITENLEEDSLEEFLIILPTSRARDKHDVLKPRINELLHHEAWNIEPLKTGMSDKLSAAVAQLKRKYGHSEQMQKVFEEMNEIVQFPF